MPHSCANQISMNLQWIVSLYVIAEINIAAMALSVNNNDDNVITIKSVLDNI